MLQVGAGRRKCMDASEIHKFSTWQQVLQRGNPFCDKGGLREQRQSEFCSKRHHGHVKKISPGGSGFSRPSATAQVFLNFNEREYNTLFSLPPFPAQTQARTRTEGPPTKYFPKVYFSIICILVSTVIFLPPTLLSGIIVYMVLK